MAARIDPEAWDQFLAQAEQMIPEEFKQKVRFEVAIATQRAFAVLFKGAWTLNGTKTVPTAKYKSHGNCKKCRCPYDQRTAGCTSCCSRHGMRQYARMRIANTN